MSSESSFKGQLSSRKFQTILSIVNLKAKEWRQEEAVRIIQQYWKRRVIGYFEVTERSDGVMGMERRIYAYDASKNIYKVLLDNKNGYKILRNNVYDFESTISESNLDDIYGFSFPPTFVSMTSVMPILYTEENEPGWFYDFTLDYDNSIWITGYNGYDNIFRNSCYIAATKLKII
jgi:hypothetical protein